MQTDADADLLLDAAETLFYERGYQSVGMDTLRAESGLPLKRIYTLFPSKNAITVSMLDRRDEQWHASLSQRVDQETDPKQRVLALFDWLTRWLANEGYRGCAWINAFGELGGTSPDVTAAVRRHKRRLRSYIDHLAEEAGAPPPVAHGIFLLVEGCMVTAGIAGNTEAAEQARQAAVLLLGD